VHVLISGVALKLEARTHLILTYHDVSEQRRAEAAVQELNAQLEARVAERTALLEQANRDLEGFSYSVAHDLRAPLRAIAGFSALLEEDCKEALPPGGSHSLARISAAALRMSSLLDGLLEFARTGRAQIALAAVDMQALAAEALAEMPEVAQGRVQVQLDPLPAGRGDTLLLRQVWRNLIENACKFSRDTKTPRLHIGARALPPPHPTAEPIEPGAAAGDSGDAGARIEYFVRDNGVGFDMEHAAKLFGVFHRLHHEAQFEGTGVGLAIVQRIVHRHGGHIHAEAVPGQGATFYFSLGE
jgi:light-regulated signal transduction histidine kinase (bacteriophytochrome)